ncbi:response regulator transcription factor [Brevibacterium album]|uniref:response regulator transcription factor n=1 Tax=Brevibacterium album TaxID=417948 RepID=UPI0003FC5F70|nr:helix-turn-helix transcriptional regulator [Brevibacterium album]
MILRAASALVSSSLHDGRPPTQRELDALRTASVTYVRQLPRAQAGLIGAAMIMALMRTDQLDEAKQLAEVLVTGEPFPGDRDLPLTVLLAAGAALAELNIGLADGVTALRYALRIEARARESGDPRWWHRALGLLAAAHAVNGEFADSAAARAAMDEIVRAEGWETDRAEYMAAVAEGIEAFSRMDEQRAAALVPRMRRLVETDPSARSLADLLEAVALALAGESAKSSALATKVVQGVTQPDGPGLVRGQALALQAFLLLTGGEPLRALTLLQRAQPSPSHFICPAGLRAVAFLQLREDRQALEATSACKRRKVDHNLWSLPLVLLTRALAHMRLGNTSAALRNAGEALAHAEGSRLRSILRLFPGGELHELRAFAQKHSPQLASAMQASREGGEPVTADARQLVALPSLTKRERIVAMQLRAGLSLPRIAELLFVAPSTVKSHTLAIYRKLGVHSRAEAVQVLERAGFYEL